MRNAGDLPDLGLDVLCWPWIFRVVCFHHATLLKIALRSSAKRVCAVEEGLCLEIRMDFFLDGASAA